MSVIEMDFHYFSNVTVKDVLASDDSVSEIFGSVIFTVLDTFQVKAFDQTTIKNTVLLNKVLSECAIGPMELDSSINKKIYLS